jgi:hypothetical protein
MSYSPNNRPNQYDRPNQYNPNRYDPNQYDRPTRYDRSNQYDQSDKSDKSKKNRQILIGIAIVIFLVILVLLYLSTQVTGMKLSTKTPTPSTSTPSTSTPSTSTPSTSTPSTSTPSTSTPSTKPPPKKIVYQVSGYNYLPTEAEGVCKTRNAVVATRQQLQDAFDANEASWCSWGWTAENDNSNIHPTFPMYLDHNKQYMIAGCHSHGIAEANKDTYNKDSTSKYGVHCYGELPEDTTGLLYGSKFPREYADDPISIIPGKTPVNPKKTLIDISKTHDDVKFWACRDSCASDPSCVAMTFQNGECYNYPIVGTSVIDSPNQYAYIKYRYLTDFESI